MFNWVHDALVYIAGLFQSLIDFILEILYVIFCYIGVVLNWIIEFLWGWFQFYWRFYFGGNGRTGLFWDVVEWFLDQVGGVATFLPDISVFVKSHEANTKFVVEYVSAINVFFPISETLSMIVLFVGFIAVGVSLKLVFRLVRG